MNKIFDKVNNCLEKFIGGEIFFDELDKQIKFDKQLLEELFYKAKNEKAEVIASGEIGLCLHNYGFPIDIIVQGGLRKNKEVLDLSPFIDAN